MFERDYLMRIIERLAEAIARLVAQRQADAAGAAEETADQACRELFGVDADALVRLPLSTVLDLLGIERAPRSGDIEHGLLVARLLQEHGDTLASRDDLARARHAWIRAFCLYDELELRAGPLPAEHAEIAAQLAARLDS